MPVRVSTDDPWLQASGQERARPLSATLALAVAAAKKAGVTRLADVSGLAPFGIPVFQAVRPRARLLSVSQGKGLTPMAAMVSALLEAVELDCAERLPPSGHVAQLGALAPATIALWHDAPRGRHAIRLDPAVERGWLPAVNLTQGGSALVPWDLLSLDITCPRPPDVRAASVGLATGNSLAEASVSAVGELLEHDLQASMGSWSPRERRAAELDLGSVDAPLPRGLIDGIRRRGFAVRAWSMGHEAGIAAFRCAITDVEPVGAMLPPAGGTGCHPDRATALLRALLEAVQSRITLIAGARDDLTEADYQGARQQTLELVLGGLSFGPGPLRWSDIPDQPGATCERRLETLLDIASRRSSLPVLLFEHRSPQAGLAVVRALAPGLSDPERLPAAQPRRPQPTIRAPALRSFPKRPILFVGPSLRPDLIPSDVEVRPPATCGDIAALLDDPPLAVGLIDGCFETAPTVWHKELLDLVAHGIPVIGGASLGALRAAELHRLGMAGAGAIFEAYRDGRLHRDDAVMLVHAPAELDHRPLTIALVDAEAALFAARIEPGERRQLQRIVRRLDFRERTWRRCLDLYRERTGRAASIDARTLEQFGSVKERDALQLVAALRAGLPQPIARPRPPLTSLYRVMLEKRVRSLPSIRPPAAVHAVPA